MSQATAHLRHKRVARHRVSKVASARDTIEGFGHGMDVCGLTFGQFSLLDLIQAALEITGPADVAISTWSAGFYDVDAAERFRDNGLMRSCRFVLDSSQQKRGQATAFDVAELFGRECVRTTRSHAKFVTVANESWSVTITSSMNLNLNTRVEQFMMVDDPTTLAVFLGFVDELFASEPFSVEGRTMPALPGLGDGESALSIEATSWRTLERGKFPKVGRFE